MQQLALPRPALRFTLATIATAALTTPLLLYRYLIAFRTFDDEGYVMIVLREYARGGVLYDEVYSQYGPVFHQILTAIFSVAGFGLTHTTARVCTAMLVVFTSVLCATATWRLTGLISIAISVQALVVGTLWNADEAVHPGHLVALLLGGVAVAATGLAGRRAGAAAAAMGVLLAAVSLTKINAGGLATMSVTFAVLLAYPPGRLPPWARRALAVVFAAVPVILMAANAGDAAWRSFLIVATSGAAAVALVSLGPPYVSATSSARLGIGFAAMLATAALACGWELAKGTTLAALITGLVLEPVHHPQRYMVVPRLEATVPVAALVGLGLCAAFVAARRRALLSHSSVAIALSVVKVIAGGWIWYALLDRRLALQTAPPLYWLLLALPTTLLAPGEVLARRILAAVAALQALHAYPVAGAHIAWSSFLAGPIAGVMIVDGWRGLAAALPERAGGLARLATIAVLLLVVFLTQRMVTMHLRLADSYRRNVPLGLPGTEWVRDTPQQVVQLRQLTHILSTRCGTFLTQPGMNSFYFFTGKDPPTRLNVGLWNVHLTEAQQQRVVDRLVSMPPPVCVLRLDGVVWDTPLGRYVRDEFEPVLASPPFDLLVRRDGLASWSR